MFNNKKIKTLEKEVFELRDRLINLKIIFSTIKIYLKVSV